ncbi:hypothetical protein [Larkinella arboricola]
MLLDDPIERWEQLECYLAGRMNNDQSQLVQELIKTDRLWADEFEAVRFAQRILHEAFIEQRMRYTLQKIMQEKRQPAPQYPVWRWARIGIVISILLVCYLSVAPIALPDAGYNVMTLRNVDTTTLSPQQQKAFANFFEGQARMVEGDYVQAALHFENVLTVEDLRPYFREAAEWHLVVSYLRSTQIDRAQRLYQRLQECDPCVYDVGWLNHLKLKWQLLLADLFS